MRLPAPPAADDGATAGGDVIAAPQTEPAPQDDMAAMTAGILAQLGASAAQPPAAASDSAPEMDALTRNVLASLGAAAQSGPGTGTTAPDDLSGLIRQALNAGDGDAYVDALLNEAAQAGRIAIPPALRTAEGRVDTRTLLASLVSQASAAVEADVALLEAEARSDAPAPARPGADALAGAVPRPADRPETYVVQPGDSLAGIAYRFYGETMAYLAIYDANADSLPSPDVIRVGQRLRLP
jgi:nucleoid-associated protein YgaU